MNAPDFRKPLPAILLGLSLLTGCQHMPPVADANEANASNRRSQTLVIDVRRKLTLNDILPALAGKRVVLVGETHDQYHHHLAQLDIIKGIYERYPDIAIGLEFFQQPFQKYLDQFIAGEIDTPTLLRKTEYFDRWRFDYRLYQPILEFARDKRIPLIALNLPAEITEKVGRSGMQSLTPKEKSEIPASIDRGVPGYRERITSVLRNHPAAMQRNVDNFVDVQLLWDEGMAARAAQYLKQHPHKHMIILAGSGHIIHGTGIPQRLRRRIDADIATVVFGDRMELSDDIADYVLYPPPRELPPKGMIGVVLDSADNGMRVKSFADNSLAPKAGLQKGDVIVEINGQPVRDLTDIRLALMNKRPHDKIDLVVLRGDDRRQPRRIQMKVELRGQPGM